MRVIVITFLFFAITTLAQAQENQTQDSYTPPPLFAEPKEIPVRPKADVPSLPPISKKVESLKEDKKENKEVSEKLLVEPRVIKQVEESEVAKPAEKPTIPESQKNQGVVKGPKTMPAVKKQNVETEVTYEDDKKEDGEILERVQQPKDKIKEIKPKPPVLLDVGDKDIVDFEPFALTFNGNAGKISPNHQNEIQEKLLTYLDPAKLNVITVEAYASIQGEQMNSDRRIALSRAMSVREFLIDKGIPSTSINVRSLGSQTNKQPLDRVEISIMD